jgi:hypothetical protein
LSSGADPSTTDHAKRSDGNISSNAGMAPGEKCAKCNPCINRTLFEGVLVKGSPEEISDNARPNCKELGEKRIKKRNPTKRANERDWKHNS